MSDVLYSFRRCPYAMRARMALWVSGLPVQLREVVLRDKPEQMLQASPKGTVPVWVRADGTVIDESLAIMRLALRHHDPLGWLPATAEETDLTHELLATNDGPFKCALDRFKYSNRYEDVDELQERTRAADILADWNETLTHGWFLGDRQTLADVAIAPFVRQFAFAGGAWFREQPWPHLHDWLDRFLDSALFAAVMDKHPQWKPGDEVTWFGQAAPSP